MNQQETEKQIKLMEKYLAGGKCDSPMRTYRHIQRLKETIGL